MVNRTALRKVLRICDVGGKLLSGIKSVCIDSLTCFREKGVKSKRFRIDSRVRTRVYYAPLVLQYIYGCNDK